MNVAEQFMDRYYNKASVEEAKALTIPAVAEKIAEQVASPADAATGGREVSYTLIEKNREGKHAYVVYETTITTKETGPVRKEVYLSIDVVDGAWKVTQFDEKAAGSAVSGQQ